MMHPVLQGKRIVLGVTGSIAAYKSVVLLRWLMKAGAAVRVILTPGADRFVHPLSFNALTGETAVADLWGEDWSRHVELGLWADLMLIAPATANTLAKMAQGLCDNALMATYLAAKCPVAVAPAMDRDMYAHPATRRNLGMLAIDGVHVLPTGEGYLASGLEGPGRMLEPEQIGEWAVNFFSERAHPYWAGKRVLITAGPTLEPLDPVRFISNHSSGKMGFSIAAEAARRGARVSLIHGPVKLAPPQGVEAQAVTTALEMLAAVQQRQDTQDLFIFAAAVADYRPAQAATQKMKKGDGDLHLTLVKNPDILHATSRSRKAGQSVVGFALETENALDHARKKMIAKGADLMIVNTLEDEGAGFSVDTNRVTLLHPEGREKAFPLMDKKQLAAALLDTLPGWLPNGAPRAQEK